MKSFVVPRRTPAEGWWRWGFQLMCEAVGSGTPFLRVEIVVFVLGVTEVSDGLGRLLKD